MQKTTPKPNILSRVFELDKIYFPSLIITITGLLLDGVNRTIEFQDPFILYFDIGNIGLIILAHLIYLSGKINKIHVVLIIVYSIILSSFISIPARLNYPTFDLTTYFVKTEFVFFILALSVSAVVDKIHVPIIVTLNLFFALICLFTEPGGLYLGDFILYTIIFSGASLLVYQSNVRISKLAMNLENANETISNKNDELVELNYYKDNIVKVIGHDVRQPLTQISGLLEVYEDTKDETVVPLIKKSGEQALTMLDDALIWNNSQSLEELIQTETIDLKPVVSKIIESIAFPANSKKIKLTNNIDDNFRINADIRSLETILRNLCNNAIKFSNENSTIQINGQQDQEHFILEVKDEGVGIDLELLEEIFNGLRNSTRKGTKGEIGSGLGLIICKNLIEKQKGKLEIKSTEGKGTSVFVYFPKSN